MENNNKANQNGRLVQFVIHLDILYFQWGKIYVIYSTTQEILVKRVYESEDAYKVHLVSENKEKYLPFDIPKSDIRSLSLVVGVIRME